MVDNLHVHVHVAGHACIKNIHLIKKRNTFINSIFSISYFILDLIDYQRKAQKDHNLKMISTKFKCLKHTF